MYFISFYLTLIEFIDENFKSYELTINSKFELYDFV
ncbi:hypothetical protein SAMN05421768_10623 [Chryseobacterium joostei]|uniref:Uncharacterized protein n=1 Tax=Chryseobacterium joostei TaxID=112234 RepID=A0A1N7ILB3_9FLAO|nr:hypothetical protein SAMN05421768_10623 [Chryseobacterium joostei]